MAIKGTFVADFDSFQAAVQKAEVSLKSLDTGAGKVSTSLNKMVDSFSGRKIIQDATLMGEAFEQLASKGIGLTTRELQRMGAAANEAIEKLRAGGKDIPPGIQKIADAAKGIKAPLDAAQASSASLFTTLKNAAGVVGLAFSVGAVTRFIGSVFDAASAIKDVSTKLGISAEAAQRFKFAAEQTGATMDDVGTAIGFMNRTLAEGDKSTIQALKAAGLGFQQIRNLRPEDAFRTITEAVRGIEDPMTQARIVTELFGRSAQTLLPGIKEGFTEIGKAAQVMSDDTVESLEAAQDAWGRLSDSVIIASGTIIAKTMSTVSQVTSSWGQAAQFLENAIKFGPGMAAVMADTAAKAKTMETAFDKAFNKKFAEQQAGLNKTVYQTKVELAEGEKAARKYEAAAKKLNDEMERAAKSGVTAFKDWHAALDKLDFNMGLLVRGRLNDIGEAAKKQLGAATDATILWLKVMQNGFPVVAGLGKLLGQVGDTGVIAGQDIANAIKAAEDAARKANEEFERQQQLLGQVASSLSALGDQAGGGLGKLLKDIANITDALVLARDAAKQISQGGFGNILAGGLAGVQAVGQATGQGSRGARIAGGAATGAQVGMVAGPWGALIGAGVGALVGYIRGLGKGRDAVKEFAKAHGGFDVLRDKLGALGAEGEKLWQSLTQGVGNNNPEQAALAISQIGVALDDVPQHLNDMVTAALTGGASMDASMAPYIESLIRTGQLTQENANLLMGLPAAGVPSFDQVTGAAERLGLNIDSIGQGIKQMGFTELASSVASDLDILARAGADMEAVLTGSRDKIQKLVEDAQRFGYSLPESIKPFLQKMVESGKLTDLFGDKLEDLEDLHFEKPLEQSVDELVKAMRELVGVIRDEVGGALDDLGKKVVRPRVIPDYENVPSSPAMLSPAEAELIAPRPSSASAPSTATAGTVILELDGQTLVRALVPILPDEVQRYGAS